MFTFCELSEWNLYPVQNLGRGLELVAHVLSGLLRLLSDNSFCAIVKKVRVHDKIRFVIEDDKN